MNARLVIVCMLFLAIFVDIDSAPVYSQQKKPADRLVIAISSDFKPYSFLDYTGKPAGLFVDIWQLWSRKTGNKIEFITSDWKTSVENLKSGKADIHSGLASSPERAAWLSSAKKLYEVETALFYPVRSGKIRDITSFYGKTIAAVKGTKTEKFLSLNYPKIQIISCTNRLELLKVTQEGKTAGFVAFEMVGKSLINDQGVSGEFAVLDSVFEKENLYPSIRKENIELSARIDKSFGQLSNAELAEIEARWIPEESQRFFRTNAAVEFSPSERAWLDQRHTVRVRVGDSPPYQMTRPEPQGISIDYLKLIGKRFGINFIFVENTSLNWEMSLKDLAGERQWLDMVVAIKRTPVREKGIAFTNDYLTSPWVIVNRTDSDFISGMKDLAGKKVAVEKGFVINELIEKEYPQIKTVLFTTSHEALRSVATGGSDAYVANLAIASYLIRDMDLSNLKIAAPTPFGSHDQAMGVRKDWPELASLINKGLVAISDAEESEIRNRWLSVRYEFGIRSKEVWSWIAGLTSAFLLILAVILAWSRRLKREKVVQERLLSILEATTNELHVFDIHSWVYSYVNKSALNNLGYTLDQMQGMTPLEILPELSRDECAAVLAPLVSHEKSEVKLESVHRRKDGTDYPVEVCLQLVEARSSSSSSSSSSNHFLAVIQDITERKRTLEALLENEECFRATFEQAAVGIAQVYPDGRWLRVNQRLCDIVGYTRDELLQCTFQDITHPEDLNTDLNFVQQVLAGDIPTYSMEKRYIRKDHSLVWVNLTVGIVRDETGAPKYFVSVIEDIAARKLEEDKVVSASHEWQKTFDSINDSISLIDVDQHIKRCNQATSHLLGLEFSDIIHKPCWMLFHGSDTPIADCPMVRSKKSLKSESATIQHCDRWLEVTVDPILSDQGVMTGAVHIVRDVTERIDLTNSLQEANELFSQFMKYSPIYTFIKEVTDTGSRVLQASDNFLDMTGIASQKMLGRTMHELFPKEFADKVTADDLQVVTSKQVQVLEEDLKEGTYITYKFPIESADGRRIIAGYTIDISERKRLEQELKIQASVLSGVIESTDSAVFSTDTSCRYTSFNSSHKKIMKDLYNVDIQLGDLVTSFMTGEDAAVARANLDKALTGEAFVVEADSGDSTLVRSVFQISHNPIINSQGVVEGVAVFARDISEERMAEESVRKIQAQLIQSDKMATMGQLAAGVAHEINNPMCFVSSNMATLSKYVEKYNRYIELLEGELRNSADENLSEHISEARKAIKLDYVVKDINVLLEENNEGIERVKRIIKDLRTFSRADISEVSSVNLNDCMESTINIVINELKYSAELKRDYGDLPKVECNVQQISQVFMNLLINAAHSIQAKGEDVGEIIITSKFLIRHENNLALYANV
jgi:PAS domain S-box-containing protein